MKKINYQKIGTCALYLGVGILVIFTILFWLQFGSFKTISLKTDVLDDYGSLIGGLVGALFSVASILLLIHTIQEQGLERQTREEDEQRQKIESRFFELLKMHRENLEEIHVGDVHGKPAFQKLYDELMVCLKMANNINNVRDFGLEEEQLLNFGYLAFFFGCTEVEYSVKTFRQKVSDYAPSFVEDFIKECEAEKERLKVEGRFPHTVLEGHQMYLATYFRHLYQTARYVNDPKHKVLTYWDRYEYMGTLRAQLSPHEQILLFYNSLSVLGEAWERRFNNDVTNQLITKYNLIRNVFLVDDLYTKYFPCVHFETLAKPKCREALEEKYNQLSSKT